MIIKKDYLDRKPDYLQEEKKGIEKAVQNLDNRYKKDLITRDKFLDGLKVFQKRSEDLEKRIERNK